MEIRKVSILMSKFIKVTSLIIILFIKSSPSFFVMVTFAQEITELPLDVVVSFLKTAESSIKDATV